MPLLSSLLLVLVCARLVGRLFKQFNQPEIVGEMIAGMVLGPSILNVVQPNDELSGISELAVFLVVLSAGLEMNFKDVVNSFRGKTIIIAVLGFIVPLASGLAVGYMFDLDMMRSIFLALCISITALPVTVHILKSMNMLNTDVAKFAIAASIFNDVTALLALGVVINLPSQQSAIEVVLSVLNAGWKLIALGVGIFTFNWLLQKLISSGLDISVKTKRFISIVGTEAIFGFVVLFVLVFGFFSEAMGFHFVIGAFFGALMIEKKFLAPEHYENFEHTLNSITGGFLAPVFFAFLGLQFFIGAIESVLFVVVVLLVSILSKVVAGYVGGRIVKFDHNTSMLLGSILNGRGVMELVIAGIAYDHGFIDQGLFSVLVLMGVVTTLMTPFAIRLFRKDEPQTEKPVEQLVEPDSGPSEFGH